MATKRTTYYSGECGVNRTIRLDGIFLDNEIPHKERIDTGGVEAAHSVARRTHQRIPEQVERRVVQHGQSGRLACGMQQLPVERIILARYGVDANQVVGQDRALEPL